MDCKEERHWHIVMGGMGCPETSETVVGVWIVGDETMAELCKYDPESEEWMSMNAGTKGDALTDPDYWIEFPD